MKPWILVLLAGLLILSTQLTSAKTTKHLHLPEVKPGEWPKVKVSPEYPCKQECVWDFNCFGAQKCCPVGCAKVCFRPGPL